ncbi:MAG: TonB-dependent receptor [Ginsengibacter sp.]
MKLITILMLVATLQISAKGISQRISISVKNATIEEVFEQLQQKTGYHFIFNSVMLANAKKIDLQVTGKTIEEILTLCFKDQPFTYLIKDKVIIVKEKSPLIKPVPGENLPDALPPQTLHGVVKDEENKPIDGASVLIKKLHLGTATNKEGQFELQVPGGTHELEISFVGFKTVTQSITIGDTPPADISITLSPVTGGLNEVLVVGYGTQRKRDVTGTISSIKGDDFKNAPVSNAATSLQGRASGVTIVSGDGAPGSVPSIRVRGTGTINNADPLTVIDGVPAGGLDDVNPNDIASIEILKDASSSAIYGSRAANGVVLITTKKGNFGEKLKTTVNYFTGNNKTIKYINVLTAPDLAALKTEAYTNDGLPVPSVWTDAYYATQRTDWQHQVLTTGHTQNADVALRGGNATSSYSFSGNYYYEKGIITNSYFKRYNFRINSEHKVGNRIRVGENIVYSNTLGNSPDTRSTQTGLLWSTIRFNPAIPVVNADGTWGTSQADNQLGDINNPLATLNSNDNRNNYNRILANGFAELEIINGLKLRANYGYDQTTNDGSSFSIATPTQTRGPSLSSLNNYFNKSKSFLEEYFLTYNKKFGLHNLNLTAGYSSQIFSGNVFSASRTGFSDTNPDQRVLNLGNSSSVGNGGYNYNASGLQSYFVRANYAFNDKYLLTATMRADGSSKFAPGKRWGYFPAFSAGWRISDEKFFANVKSISSLKITGGWGQLGNQNIGDFQYLGTIGLGGGGYSYNFGTGTVNQNGAYVTSLANPNITWEKASLTNISLEFGILENRVTGTVTYFDKNTRDMLVLAQLVETYGAQTSLPDNGGNITLPNVNQGELNNHGVELELNYKGQVGKFNFSIGANGAFLHNKVTKLYGNSTYLGSTAYGRENVDISRTYEGQPIASFYGFNTNGLYQTQAEIDKDANIANDPNKGNIQPGDVRFIDQNGDGVVDDKDRVRLGDPNPRFVYGINGSANYGHFDISFNFAGVAGVQLYNADRLSGLDATQNFNWYAEEKGRWHGEGTSNSIPRLSRDNLNNNYRSSDLWVQNGAYLSLKSVALGYTFSKQRIANMDLPDIRLYISGYNLFYITKYTGYTPELGYTGGNLQRGVDVAQYPQARNFTIGGTINF